MCSTCCALGLLEEYREHKFLVSTGVVSRTCGRLGGEEKVILKWLLGRMNSELIRVA
jgi:hypothetical protein